MQEIIDEKYLVENPTHVFVFGDNTLRVGNGGAAALRHLPNTYGFITKKKPTHNDEDFYNQYDYVGVYMYEIDKLRSLAIANPKKTYLISKLGAGLANKYNIWETVVKPTIKNFLDEPNIVFLW